MFFYGKIHRELAEIRQLLEQIKQQEFRIMSQITDWADQQQTDLTSISNTLDGIVAGVAALDVLITNFQNSPGVLSAADQAALDGVQAASKALVAKVAAISTAAPGQVVPPVQPAARRF